MLPVEQLADLSYILNFTWLNFLALMKISWSVTANLENMLKLWYITENSPKNGRNKPQSHVVLAEGRHKKSPLYW